MIDPDECDAGNIRAGGGAALASQPRSKLYLSHDGLGPVEKPHRQSIFPGKSQEAGRSDRSLPKRNCNGMVGVHWCWSSKVSRRCPVGVEG